jgi:hypothetical protein
MQEIFGAPHLFIAAGALHVQEICRNNSLRELHVQEICWNNSLREFYPVEFAWWHASSRLE